MSQAELFQPQNELEQHLLNALEGRMEEDDFIACLFDAQVFMPVQNEAGQTEASRRDSAHAQPLLLQDESGQPVLVLFTSPERAREFVSRYPGCGGGLLASFSWVLRQLGGPATVVMNPDQEAGFDLDAASVAELMSSLPAEQA